MNKKILMKYCIFLHYAFEIKCILYLVHMSLEPANFQKSIRWWLP